MRFLLALKCFFLVLFAKRLPPEAAALLPPEPAPPPLPVREAELVPPSLSTTQDALASTQPMSRDGAQAIGRDGAQVIAREGANGAAALPVTQPSAAPVVVKKDDGVRGAVQLLAILQREGRLLDFLQEEIDGYGDAQIGAAVRDIHRGCKKALAEHFPLEPVLREQENATVRVDAGFDPSRIRLTGNVLGEPPYTGVLKHHGWRTAKVLLPAQTAASDPTVVAPAEVEI